MPDVGFRVCIIGAGVVGLTTALKLQTLLGNGIKCILIADKFTIDTTSHVAAGIFKPSTSFNVSSSNEITKKCLHDSYQYYMDLLDKQCGVLETSGYTLSRRDQSLVKNPYLEGLLPEYRQLTDDELAVLPGNWRYGTYLKTVLVECKYYLPWAMKRLEENGGKIVTSAINNVSEVEKFGKFDLIMNCSGLGSKKLFGDSKLVPIRGQVYKVHAPWLDNKFYFDESDTYIIPCSRGMATLGGTRNYDSWRTDVCKYDTSSIWERCVSIVPRLAKDAVIVDQYVGLRPHRDGGVRIEGEIINGLKVIHNYGHGGYGVTSAPGTADQAIKLAIQYLKLNTSKL